MISTSTIHDYFNIFNDGEIEISSFFLFRVNITQSVTNKSVNCMSVDLT